MAPPITLLTDFGFAYTAAMKGRILGVNPQATVVDISHAISAHNLREGAFILRSVVRFFPPAIHVCVVDPGVGTERRGLILRVGDTCFVGPDNGLMVPAARSLAKDPGDIRATTITKQFPGVSRTFHGRDIFAPIAGHLSLGQKPEEFGNPTPQYVNLDLENYEVREDVIQGEVVYLDDFGNIVTNIPGEKLQGILAPGGQVALFGKLISVTHTYGEVPHHHPLALIGSHGCLELSLNQGNAAEFFNVKAGDKMALKVLRR